MPGARASSGRAADRCRARRERRRVVVEVEHARDDVGRRAPRSSPSATRTISPMPGAPVAARPRPPRGPGSRALPATRAARPVERLADGQDHAGLQLACTCSASGVRRDDRLPDRALRGRGHGAQGSLGLVLHRPATGGIIWPLTAVRWPSRAAPGASRSTRLDKKARARRAFPQTPPDRRRAGRAEPLRGGPRCCLRPCRKARTSRARLFGVTPNRPVAAVGVDHLAGDPAAVVARQPCDQPRGVVGLAPAAERQPRALALEQLRAWPSRCRSGRGRRS